MKAIKTAVKLWCNRLFMLAPLILLIYVGFHYMYIGRPFDETVWKAERSTTIPPPTRWLMADDLMHRVLKSGMVKKRVVELLGPPDHEENTVFLYDIGFPTGEYIDEDVLEIQFDKYGHVTEFSIYNS
jgi:hypothetical protein